MFCTEGAIATTNFIIPIEGTDDQFAISENGSIVAAKWDGKSTTATIDRTIVVFDKEGKRINDAKGRYLLAHMFTIILST